MIELFRGRNSLGNQACEVGKFVAMNVQHYEIVEKFVHATFDVDRRLDCWFFLRAVLHPLFVKESHLLNFGKFKDPSCYFSVFYCVYYVIPVM